MAYFILQHLLNDNPLTRFPESRNDYNNVTY